MRRKIDDDSSPASRWITAKELSEIAGCALSTAVKHINAHCKKHYDKKPHEHGNTAIFVDRNDLSVQKFIERHKKKQKHRRETHNSPQVDHIDDLDDDIFDPSKPIDIEESKNAYGIEVLKDIVSIRHKNAATKALQMKIDMRRGELIKREIVDKVLFGYLELLSARLFDLCEQHADTFVAIVKCDPSMARIALINALRDEHARVIQDAKRDIRKSIDEF